MAAKVTFLHTADLHLGAPFKGLRSIAPEWADYLVQAIPHAFQTIIQTAISESVDFVIIAGDIFDAATPSYADSALFIDGMKQLQSADIPVYFVTGNHDPYTSWQRNLAALPDNVTMLGVEKPAYACFTRNNEPCVLIGGRGYYSQAWPEGDDISKGISRTAAEEACGVKAPFAVGVLHTGLDIDPTRSPVAPGKLYKRGMDYWACGHIHHYAAYPNKKNQQVCFAGCPQGRDMKETGQHGVLKVTLEEGRPSPSVEFISCAQVVWERERIDVSACATLTEIQEAIVNRQFALNANAQCQRMVFRITLFGATELHEQLKSNTLEDLRNAINGQYPFFFIDEILAETHRPLNRKKLRSEGLFPAVFMNQIKNAQENPDEFAREIEQELYAFDAPTLRGLRSHFKELSGQAETTVLDLLQQGGKQ